MKLTPLDLQQKTFRKLRFGGIDEREVRQFLDLVGSELEELKRRLDKQDEELRRREARITEFKDREQLLQQTLTTVQKLADDVRAGARFVDSGHIVTSAGVSAGVDAALYVVARLLGPDVARETARRMEYESTAWRE